MYPSEPFPHFVDDYLAYLYEVHPTQASLDGVHLHDDLLEDLSRPAIDTDVRAPVRFRPAPSPDRRVALVPVEQVEHRIVGANIESRMYESERFVRGTRNPQIYADTSA
jgi:hypothetical protein